MNRRGFTLIELLISLGIGAIVILAAATIALEGNRWFIASEGALASSSMAMVTLDTIGRDIENAGGGPVRSWMAIWHENSPCAARPPLGPCGSADRLTIATAADVPAADCTVTAAPGPNAFRFESTPACCFSRAPTHLMIVQGLFWTQALVQSFDPAVCEATVVPGPMAPHDRATASWVGGRAVSIRVGTYYLDANAGQLRYYNDRGGVPAPGDDVVIADSISDFQVALGYDFRPTDGFIAEGPRATDEILGNAPGEALGAGYFALASPINLQAVLVGIVSGVPLSSATAAASGISVLDGAPQSRPGFAVRAFQGRFTPRQSFRF